MLTVLRALPRNVWLIGLISLCNDSASEMVYPLVPLYLASVLMAGPRALGLIEGVAETTASLLKLFSGVIMDRTRSAKPWIVFGYSLAGIGRPLTALAGSWAGVLALRFMDRVGKGLRSSPRDVLLASCVTPEHYGLAFGLHRAMDNAGAVIGPLAAYALLAMGASLRHVFWAAALPGAVCIYLTLRLREKKPGSDESLTKTRQGETPTTPPARKATPAFSWRLSDMPAAFKRYLLVVALFTLGNSSNMFLLLRARELGIAERHIPLLWAAVSVVAMVFSMPLSSLSDRLGRVKVLACGYVAYGVFYGILGGAGRYLADAPFALLALFAFYGLFMGATEGVEKALVADLIPAERRGTGYGWFNLVSGVFLLPASVIFGTLYQNVSPVAAFAFSGACAFGAAALLLFFAPQKYPPAS